MTELYFLPSKSTKVLLVSSLKKPRIFYKSQHHQVVIVLSFLSFASCKLVNENWGGSKWRDSWEGSKSNYYYNEEHYD
jgi:hypothetical protein